MICPQCSANLPDKSVFCGKCGKRLSMFSTNQSLKESSPSNIQESDLQLNNTVFSPAVAVTDASLFIRDENGFPSQFGSTKK